MIDSTPSTCAPPAVSPYRSPARSPAPCDACAPGWAVFVIDGCMVLVVAATVLTIGRWSALVDGAAQTFLGF